MELLKKAYYGTTREDSRGSGGEMMNMRKTVFFIFLFVCFNGLYGQDFSKVFISAKTKGFLQKGVGVTITIMNVNTMVQYTSKPLGIFSRHSTLVDIVPGEYVVSKLEFPIGNSYFNVESEMLTYYFDTLDINCEGSVYLGDFRGTRKVSFHYPFEVSLFSQEVPERLEKIALRKKLIGKDEVWTYQGPSPTLKLKVVR